MASHNLIVSIIVPIYNVIEYIWKAIHSGVNQTFENFEFIIVNDGSDFIKKLIKFRKIIKQA